MVCGFIDACVFVAVDLVDFLLCCGCLSLFVGINVRLVVGFDLWVWLCCGGWVTSC